jgi:PKD repeat protein
MEISAPGVDILSTYPGDGYATGDGTSMACPHVAGTAALVIAATGMDPAGVRAQLIVTADDLGDTGWDNWYGHGLVDAEEAAAVTSPNTPPVAEANGPYSGTEDAPIAFSGSGSSDPDGDPLTYSWDFGDGTTGAGAQPTHTYAWGGTFTVTLTVNDGRGGIDTDTATATIIEVNNQPVADPNGPYSGTVDNPISFDGTASYDPDNQDGTPENDQPLTYNWDFGDGTTGVGAQPTHTYDAEGTYQVTLTVYDGVEYSDPTTTTVDITTQPVEQKMIVQSIVLSTGRRTAGRNEFVWAIATITITTTDGSPLGGATVNGHWEISTSDIESGLTNTYGIVEFQSDSVKNPSAATYKFVIDQVTLTGYTYDPANSETTDQISI